MSDVQAPADSGQGAPVSPAPTNIDQAAGQAAASPQQAPIPWLSNADEITVGYVQNKGFKDPAQVVESYRNLEKLLGADRAGRTVVLPGENASPEDMAAFYNKLGRPDTPDNYKLAIPEVGGDPAFAKAAAAKMHELGLSTKQGQELVNWWNGTMGDSAKQSEAAKLQAFQADEAALKAEWGAAHDQKVVVAKNVASSLGLDAPTIDKLQAALGHKGVMQLLDKIGSKAGEDSFVSGGQNAPGFSSAMTPGQAQAKIQELRADKNFVARYLNKDVAAVDEMKRLHSFAYPEQ
jgi:hypothetical protein